MIWTSLAIQPSHDAVHEVGSVAFLFNCLERLEDPQRFCLGSQNTGCDKTYVIKETRNPSSFEPTPELVRGPTSSYEVRPSFYI
jgi:hypothetical protein